MMQQTRGIYLISVVAETLDMHPQTLRKYERAGFVVPLRMGALRTYSDEDVARLRLIKHFVDDMGLNLSGVQLALKMTSELLALRRGDSISRGSGGAHRRDAGDAGGARGAASRTGTRARPGRKLVQREPGRGGGVRFGYGGNILTLTLSRKERGFYSCCQRATSLAK